MNKRFSWLVVLTLLAIVVVASFIVWYENWFLSSHNSASNSNQNPFALANFATDLAVADGKVFAVDNNGNVFCFDSQSGLSLWNASVGSYMAMGSVIETYQGRVYVGVRGGIAKALDENTGAVELQTPAPLGNDIDWKTAPSVTVAYGMVIASSADSTNAYNASTGAFLWNSTAGGPLFWYYSYPQVFVPFGVDGLFCIPTLSSVNPSNGKSLWSISGSADGPPVFSDDRVILWNYKTLAGLQSSSFGSGQTLLCVNSSTGATLWSFPVGSSMYEPTVSSGTVFFGAQNGNLYAVNLADGTLEWKRFVDDQNLIGSFQGNKEQNFITLGASRIQVDNETQRIFWSMIVSNNGQDVYNGTVWCLNAKDGNRIWTLPVTDNHPIDTAGSASVSMALSKGTLYVAQHSDLYLINENTGSTQSMRSFNHYILPPVVSNGSVYVAADLNIFVYK